MRLAVVRIGEGVETIRAADRARWRRVLREAGFESEPVFLPPFLAGRADAAAIRVAAARAGAQGVIAYTTTSAVSAGPVRASAAVLCFAKCMLLDVRTECLHFNAEGECRLRRLGLPGTVCPECLEGETLAGAVEALGPEIGREIERITE